MSNLLQGVVPDPRAIARMKALAALYGQQQEPQVSDENPTAAPPAPAMANGRTNSNSPTQAGQPSNNQQPSASGRTSLSTPGAISSAMANPQTAQTAAPNSSAPIPPATSAAASVQANAKPTAPTLSGPQSSPQKPSENPLAMPGGVSKAMAASTAPTAEPPADYATRFRTWEQSGPTAPDPEDYKSGLLRKLFGAAAAFGLGATGNPQIGEEIGSDIAHPGLRQARSNYNRAEGKWQKEGAAIEKEAGLSDLDERIKASEATAQRAADNRSLDQLYTDAVRAGDTGQQAQILDAIKGLEGAKRGEETPFSVWRQQNPSAPVGAFFTAEKGGKEFTDPFQAYMSGNPEQQKAAKDFLTFEKQQGARFERPDEIQERYQLYKRDPEAYRDMFGNRGSAQDQAQAARMLKYFDAQKNRVTNDFTLSDDDKKQQLAEITNLEQPYLVAAGVQPPGGQGVPAPARNAGSNQNANANGNPGGPRKDEVEVTNPEGVRGYIPKANLAKALKQGYKQVNAQ